jgi:hypothetical protein
MHPSADHPLQQLPPPDLDDSLSSMGACLHWVPVESRVDGFRTLMSMGHGRWRNNVSTMLKSQPQQQQGDEQQQQELRTLLLQQQPATVKLLGKFDEVEQWLAADVLPGLERHAWLGGLHLLLSKYCKRQEVRLERGCTA